MCRLFDFDLSPFGFLKASKIFIKNPAIIDLKNQFVQLPNFQEQYRKLYIIKYLNYK